MADVSQLPALSQKAIEFLNDDNVHVLTKTANLNNLEVDNQGRLVQKGVWSRFKSALGWNQSEQDLKMAQVMTRVMKMANEINEISVESPLDAVTLHPVKANQLKLRSTINQLFFEKLPQLKINPLNKKNQIISEELQNYLDPRLKQIREAAQSAPEAMITPDFKLTLKLAEAQFAARLGVGAAANKGATGTRILRSVSGESVGVFKPGNRDINFCTWVKNLFKKTFFGQLYYLNSHDLAQSKAEVAAYLADQHFKFNFAPPSTLIKLNQKEGAFQLFISGYQEAKEVLAIVDQKESFSESELNLFQKMAAYDYLLGNLDRHSENWFVKVAQNAKGKTEIVALIPIDNANSFIEKNPTVWTKPLAKNQYQWKKLQLAKQEFTEETKRFIREELTNDKVETYITHVKDKLPDFFNSKMELLLRQRVNVIQKMADKSKATLFDLGACQTDAEIHQFLGLVKRSVP